MPSPTTRLAGGLLTATLAASLLIPTSATAAAEPQAPGTFTGYGFDTCVAPSQKVMDAWKRSSPYSVIGIYTSGNSRYCGDKYQPNLSREWVQKNADNGWRFLPIHVGYQSPCFKNNSRSRVQKKRMSSTLATARSQGISDAQEAIAALKKYGFGPGSVAYLDIEHYGRTASCDNAVLEFTDTWTETLQAAGYRSGVYSSGSAAIKAIDDARVAKRPGFTLPDQMWNAWTNKKADVDGGPYMRPEGWKKQRIHQYHNNVTQTFGGQRLVIDKNYLEVTATSAPVGSGSVTPAPAKCPVSLNMSTYPRLRDGTSGTAVSALQCLLADRGINVKVTGKFDATTAKGIDTWRKRLGWGPTGHTTAPTWTSLLAAGSVPKVLKQGSKGEPVERLQRALRASGAPVSLSGTFDTKTKSAVATYRKGNRLKSSTTVDSAMWKLLQRGRPVR